MVENSLNISVYPADQSIAKEVREDGGGREARQERTHTALSAIYFAKE